jgi:hypothetical protein
MSGVFAALAPIFLLIVAGAVMRRLEFPGAAFWPLLERLTYFILFPGLLFHALASADFSTAPIGRLGLVLVGMMAAMAISLLAARRFLPLDGPGFTSLFQGAVRWNSFVALAAIDSLYGQAGLTLAAVAIAVMVPAANVFSVLVLIRYGGEGAGDARMILEQIVRNPLLQACAAGIAVQALDIPVPGPLLTAARMLGDASLALGLFAVGAGLDLAITRTEQRMVALASGLKLFAMPGLAAALCWSLGVDGMVRGCAIICAAVPGAASSYILAKQLGGNAELMSGITTVQTLAAMASMPLVLWAIL